jgi:hypothetical protein
MLSPSRLLAREPTVFTKALSSTYPNSGGFACLAIVESKQELRRNVLLHQIGLHFQPLGTVRSEGAADSLQKATAILNPVLTNGNGSRYIEVRPVAGGAARNSRFLRSGRIGDVTPSMTQIPAHSAWRDISPGSSFNQFWQNLTNRLIHGFNFIQLSRFAALGPRIAAAEASPCGKRCRPEGIISFSSARRGNCCPDTLVFGWPTRLLP